MNTLNKVGTLLVSGMDAGVVHSITLESDMIPSGLEIGNFVTNPTRVNDEMTVKELKEYATNNNIDLAGASLKDDIIERINNE